MSKMDLGKNKSPFFSYIIAIWNANNTLEKCLDSIRCQTFNDFEVILIDDGSTDGSSEIARRFAQIDSRFRYYRQQNKGSSSAYNQGWRLSQGKYLVYLDNDDWNSHGTLNAVYKAVSSDPSIDIVQFSLIVETLENGTNATFCKYALPRAFVGRKEIRTAAKNDWFDSLTHSGKAIRRDLFAEQQILFEGFAKGADLFVIRKLICLANKIVVVPAAEWHFFVRPNSQSHAAINTHVLPRYHRYGIEMVLKDLPFYLEHLPPDEAMPIWQLDNLAWDSLVGLGGALKATGNYDPGELSSWASKIWRNRIYILSSKKRRFGLLIIRFAPRLFFLLKR